MTALDRIVEWDVDNAAAAVFDRDTVRETVGRTDRPFELASVSKVIAAVAVHVATEEGSIALDDPVGPPGSTVRHLLAHASGLAPDGEGDDAVLAAPGSRRIYSNLGFELLGHHVADRTEIPLEHYVRLGIVQPLALAATDVAGTPAHGYRSSVDDLCTLLGAVLDGRVLAPETVEAMTTPAFPDLDGVLPGYGRQEPNPWGLGVEVRGQKSPHWTSPDNSPRSWGHFGRAGTFVWFDPAVDVGLVVLTDRDFGQWAVDAWPDLSSAVLAEHP